MSTHYLALAGVVLLSAASQILLKRGVTDLVLSRGFRAALASLRPGLVAGVAAVGVSTVLYIWALTGMELGTAFAVTALTQIVVVAAGRVFLRERMRALHLVGFFLVILGLVIWTLP